MVNFFVGKDAGSIGFVTNYNHVSSKLLHRGPPQLWGWKHISELKGQLYAVLFTFNATIPAGESIGVCPNLGKVIDTDPSTSSAMNMSLVMAICAAIAACWIIALLLL
jgi:hypothetical protein